MKYIIAEIISHAKTKTNTVEQDPTTETMSLISPDVSILELATQLTDIFNHFTSSKVTKEQVMAKTNMFVEGRVC